MKNHDPWQKMEPWSIDAAAPAGLPGCILSVNALLGFFQEHRAEAALAALKNMHLSRAIWRITLNHTLATRP
ncbi:MAG: hypothetical protein AW09_003826 [Candidatus Accumulibacter phosphatis]|jgi:magnesium-transporting ATPase (P-type)|uniref:Uncharacterized protein n=1 Tax=Candidatus Accumulibacter phosphatis TaxID=327160 RepID=A0A080M1Q9_9PROT|nr:MAG: hypothetical protein AW09_003826 [Candidatus Accumulibacter phosphatis]